MTRERQAHLLLQPSEITDAEVRELVVTMGMHRESAAGWRRSYRRAIHLVSDAITAGMDHWSAARRQQRRAERYRRLALYWRQKAENPSIEDQYGT